jgi:hypothetical protein
MRVVDQSCDKIAPNLTETWQSRAKECRAAAKRLHSVDARNRMLAAAEDFERMANKARDNQPAGWTHV